MDLYENRQYVKSKLKHPLKRKIISVFKKHRYCTVDDIQKKLKISRFAAFEHVLELENMKIVEKKEKPPYYNINREQYEKARNIYEPFA